MLHCCINAGYRCTGSEGALQGDAWSSNQHPTAVITGTAQLAAAAQQGSASHGNPWAADEFEAGQIPEEPPPHMYCQA